jgi:16S rRNA (cytosine967-C5)-methyltransferase
VPCSNTGVLARRIEGWYRFAGGGMTWSAPRRHPTLHHRSRRLDSSQPGGRIIYSTCSLGPEENEHQVEWATASGVFTLNSPN